MRCCGAGCRAPGKGWERKGRERIERPNGLADRAASAAAIRPGSGRTSSAIANMADRPLNWIGNAWERRLDSADKFARAATAAAKSPSGHPSRGAATDLSPDPLRMGRWEAPLHGSLARTRQNRKLRTFSDSLSTVCPPAWQVATSGRTGQAWITCQLSHYTNYRFPPPRRAQRSRGRHWRLRHSRKWTRDKN
jgi:hypothetical protein